ncbi:Chemotaxis response regulator protein-glutamate methylesterase CheB [hydrothermal vent metagenome]|uniref:Chemotaxis response regulator protein-glutamate methylesterase CheB n=1 Tax=hydrothermal vent metagenome TaxID=652676 RepID=A0A3B1DDN4_9ZZZZ
MMIKKILVIDDDATSVHLMQARLKEKGFEVIVANDGDVGLEKASVINPDLIILDVEMPRMNGYTFMTALKKDEKLKSTRVIVLTSNKDTAPIFARKGIKVYLIKPVDFDKLFEAIDMMSQLS